MGKTPAGGVILSADYTALGAYFRVRQDVVDA